MAQDGPIAGAVVVVVGGGVVMVDGVWRTMARSQVLLLLLWVVVLLWVVACGVRWRDRRARVSSFRTLRARSHLVYVSRHISQGEGFVISHFAGEVAYEIEGFVDKNRDALPGELSLLLSSSEVCILLFLDVAYGSYND